MVRLATERILLIGDSQRQMQEVLAQAAPGAQVTPASNYFDGIAELAANTYTTVLAAAEPIERRPESAIRTLRHLAPDARLVLFGHPGLEPLSRRMLEFGCDDYLVTPTGANDLQSLLIEPVARPQPQPPATRPSPAPAEVTADPFPVESLPLAQIMLDSLVGQPHDAPQAAVRAINQRLGGRLTLHYVRPGSAAPTIPEGLASAAQAVTCGKEDCGQLLLFFPRECQGNSAQRFVAHLAELFASLQTLQDRHTRLQTLAITDELTGVYNGRYFRHFLSRILDLARARLFPVTLFIFDIDNFKRYNDQFGHGAGDEILKQTAALIKRCCREHDLVARLGGDEFAVVFWEKEGVRQPKQTPTGGGQPLRPPQTPEQVLQRFQRLLAKEEFRCLGPSGKGTLTISGGVAVFPYHANTMDALIELADQRLMFGAKKAGKNSIFLIGGTDSPRQS